jgi:quinoprotein glucose dehydrogenase
MVNDFARLAALTTKPNIPVPALYRALNAHFRIGNRANAEALATFAARSDVPSNLRVLALKMLGDWGKPPRRDYITGLTQNLPRDASVAVDALKAGSAGSSAGPPMQKQAITAAASWASNRSA